MATMPDILLTGERANHSPVPTGTTLAADRRAPNDSTPPQALFSVSRVTVQRQKAAWIITAQACRPWNDDDLQAFRDKIHAAAPGLRELSVHIECPLEEPAQLLDPFWECLIRSAVPENRPGVRKALMKAPHRLRGDGLVISVDPAQANWLRSRRVDRDLAETADRLFGVRLPILLEEAEPQMNDEYLQAQEEEEKRLLAEQFKAAAEANGNGGNGGATGGGSGGDKGAVPAGEIYGKAIGDTAFMPLKDIQDEEKSVIIQGRVFGLETRDLKSGRRLVTFNVTDESDSITVKVFEGEKENITDDGRLKDGAWVKVRGSVQLDKWQQELTVLARDINGHKAVIRPDNAEVKRVELHAHTKMSSMDGLVSAKELVTRAAHWGHPAVAITDHGVVQAFPEAFEVGRKLKIKVIYGVEGYLVEEMPAPNGEKLKSWHIIILVKDMTGLKNLYKLITKSHLEHYERRPRIPRKLLEEHREGLILGSACEAGELFRAMLQGAGDDELKRIAAFYDYLEIQPIGNNLFLYKKGEVPSEEALRDFNRRVLRIADEMGKPIVATGDVHFLEPRDECYRRILMAGKGFADADDQAPLYLRTTDEMLAEFRYLGEADARRVVIDNPRRIADMVDGEIKPIPDELYPPVIDGAEDQIREMTEGTAAQLYGDPLPEVVRKRVDKELNSIITNGFSVLYLIAHKLVKKSNDDGYLVGSRGSVGSSLVATFTGITEVNPLPPHYRCGHCKHSEFILDGSIGCGADLPDKACPKCGQPLIKDGHDIPFETFLGFEGDKVPDIDLNFSGDYQPRAHKFTEELFGKDYVFRAGTIATIAERTAYGFVKNYMDEKKIPARGAELSRLVCGCTGVKRTTGQHPGGLMVVPRNVDIHDFTPLQRPADDTKSDTITTHFDYHSISSRLVKLDILGHDDPTVIKMLEDLTNINPKGIPLDDAKTMSLFCTPEALGVTPEQIRSNTGTYGIPEFGTKFVRQMLEDTKPKTFSDLVRISGFSHGTDVWLNNAQDLIKSGTCKTGEAISTRDDIMIYLMYQGLPPKKAFSIMEGVRKGKGVKPDDEQLMRDNRVPEWYIESCKKIKYMFPKAHAVAYVTMAFRIAWFKVYYPEAFYASFFTVRADEFDADLICQGSAHVRRTIEEIERKGNEATAKEKNLQTILELALEMYERGIHMQRVNLERSHAARFIIEPEGLLPPIGGLPGVGVTAAQNIMDARKEGPFSSIEDLRVRSRVSKTVIEALQKHGTLDGMCETDQMCLF
ncbi:DNA polymerase-3 subunit alpha (Gram-positive type) [Heliobacterium gestii]|nr:DNA polymerase-3 subunit alpha (Gram-positive type) [Heliomicrobium gestii]